LRACDIRVFNEVIPEEDDIHPQLCCDFNQP